MSKLKFSVLVSATGHRFDSSTYDSSIHDVINACDQFLGESEPTEDGETEYGYLARENGCGDLEGMLIQACADRPELCEWIYERYPEYRASLWWATCCDYQNSGILDSREFFEFLKKMPCIFEDCETMGTLGGPLGGLVPDVAFTTESQQLILSMRATPFLEDDSDLKPITEDSWNRLKPFYRDPWLAS